jgi:5-carboxymethyl-2-hydroxymuconate isomerase
MSRKYGRSRTASIRRLWPPVFSPLGGIRLRFQVIDDYIIGDGHPDNSFVHVVLRIGVGRDAENQEEIGGGGLSETMRSPGAAAAAPAARCSL